MENTFYVDYKITHVNLFYRTMRITAFLLLFCSFCAFADSAHSQAAKVTINKNNVTLVEVLNEIESQTNYLFVYSHDVDVSRHISIKVNKKSVVDVLAKLFEGEKVTYQLEGTHIIVKKIKDYSGSGTSVVQQSKHQKGKVLDNDGVPIIGASVIENGTKNGTITDVNGDFSISVEPNAVLRVSYIGYKGETIKASPEKMLVVVLKEESKSLNEVVVVGYGTQRRANLTGAVDQVSSDVFEGRPTSNVVQMLQGSIPNLNLSLSDGKPTRSASFNIRGTTSIGQGGSALVLIDGVEGNPSLLNPDDIESVTVLKDAASSAIYGSRAPYGVVLITTKTAKKGSVQVNYSTNFTFEQPTNIPDVESDGYTWTEHFYNAYYNYNHSNPSGINKTQQFSTAWLEEYKARKESGNLGTVVSDGSWGMTKGRWVYFNDKTDYVKMLYKNTVFAQTHNISLSGQEGKFNFYLSGRYYGYGGLFDSPNNTDKYNMYNTRLKVEYQIKPWLKITDNFDISSTRYKNPVTYSEGDGVVWRNLQDEGHPSSPIWNPDGTMTYSAVYSSGDLLYGNSYRIYKNSYVRNTMGFNMNFLKNTLRVNGDFTYRDQNYYRTIHRVRTPYSKSEGITETVSGTQSYISELTQNTIYMATNAYAEYENIFAKKHYLKGLIGYNYEQSQLKDLYGYNDDLLTEDVENINLAMGTDNRSVTGSWSKWRTVGAFFRLNYVFDDRYLFEVNGRYDGSSKFPSEQRWAFFPSVSAGWRVSSEHWFKVDPKYVSNVKLRASYGSLGNSNISAYSYDENFSVSTGRIINGVKVRYTSAPDPIPHGLTWETARTFDIGADLGFFNNCLSITGDWYQRKTLNMYTVGPTLPDVFGASSPKGNYGDMTTKGYEIAVTWHDSFKLSEKPFNYTLRATLADYQSTIDKYNNATKSLGTSNSPSYYEGRKVGEIWGFVSNGLWQTEDDINTAEAKAVAAGQAYYNPLMQTDKKYKLYPGDVKFEDLNGNGYIDRGQGTKNDPGDRRIIGNTTPRYHFSFNASADWNNIFFSVFFQGVGKQDWYPSNEAASIWGQYNRPYNQMPRWHEGNYWTEDNPNAYLPRYAGYYAPFYKGSSCANTRYMQNVAYIRLQNLQLGYNLPTKFIQKFGLKKFGIFFSGENLWTWSPLYKRTKDYDPATINDGSDEDLNDGYGDGNNYPTMKSYSFGFNITF